MMKPAASIVEGDWVQYWAGTEGSYAFFQGWVVKVDQRLNDDDDLLLVASHLDRELLVREEWIPRVQCRSVLQGVPADAEHITARGAYRRFGE